MIDFYNVPKKNIEMFCYVGSILSIVSLFVFFVGTTFYVFSFSSHFNLT